MPLAEIASDRTGIFRQQAPNRSDRAKAARKELILFIDDFIFLIPPSYIIYNNCFFVKSEIAVSIQAVIAIRIQTCYTVSSTIIRGRLRSGICKMNNKDGGFYEKI